eukprot:CAMPEP_0172185214 /NCGR_PEP_ID=MMETSP1050-20130122/20035_1 /TAXON_ID=233186 /ORGANISM="Cryptomonas curvata, Strain CCAP979/52" /LENGTH=217 /DNA_ID=CAMNT_0012859155 /DNA_START=148 /DNA_END=797 /DNA_ORIENTATION=-
MTITNGHHPLLLRRSRKIIQLGAIVGAVAAVMTVLISQLPSEMEIETFSGRYSLFSPYRLQRARLDFAQDSERPIEWIDRNQVPRDKFSSSLARVEEADTSSTHDLEILAREDRNFNPRRSVVDRTSSEFRTATSATFAHQLEQPSRPPRAQHAARTRRIRQAAQRRAGRTGPLPSAPNDVQRASLLAGQLGGLGRRIVPVPSDLHGQIVRLGRVRR